MPGAALDSIATPCAPAVTVIIPTRGLPERADSIRRAIDSVLTQSGVRAQALVVLNGRRFSADVERRVRGDQRVTVIERKHADLAAALRAGREAVDTPWFATLDDDDLLLPGALARRIAELVRRPECDVVVTNGFRRDRSGDVLHVPPGSGVADDPLRALLRRNWLLPGSWLCRAEVVGPALFDGMPRYLECTYLAASFATRHRMCWLDEPTMIYHVGSPSAESRSAAYVAGQPDALRGMLKLSLPDDVWRRLRLRVGDACHWAADHELHARRLEQAWRWHAATLREPGGWRYLPFTRHVVRAAWRARS